MSASNSEAVSALRGAAVTAGARLRDTECLGPCERSNVVVVRPKGKAPALWFGRVLTAADTAALCEWLAAGGPAAAPVPVLLADRLLDPPRPAREAG